MTTPQPNAKANPPLPDGRGSDCPFRIPHSAFRIHSSSRTQNSEFRIQNSEFAFTLIEMLVVITIIAILMATIVAVGTSVRANANRRSTLAELKLLSNDMKDYIAAGNPEPRVPTEPSSPTGWYYSGPEAYDPTLPASDLYNWVIALKSDPRFSKKLDGLPSIMDSSAVIAATTVVPHTLIVDSFGTPIRYVPSSGNTPGYFMSAGPDGKLSNAVTPGTTTLVHGSSAANPPIPADEIYSTDPQ